MPSRGSSGLAVYMAWDTSANKYKVGDAANHTIFMARDGVFSGAQNQTAITELSASTGAAAGSYQIAWTSAEGTTNTLWIGGNSSTASIAIIPITIGFENLPLLPSVVTSVSGIQAVNVTNWGGTAVNSLTSGRVDVTVGQTQIGSIYTSTFTAGALATTVFPSNWLTSALIDTTASNAMADALLDRTNAIETGLTPRQSWRLDAAALGGNLSGAGLTAVGVWGAGVTTTRISAATDQSGNRSNITLNL